ncbi:hypothetical protein EDB19DRAFT_1637197, partial [Suillus lakei]
VSPLALKLSIPQLLNILCNFLFAQLNLNNPYDPLQIPPAGCPQYNRRISIVNLTCLTFFTPNNLSGIGGMYYKHIYACPT